MQSPRKYEPARKGDQYVKVLKSPKDMHPSLLNDPKAKWYNPGGEYFTIELFQDDQWHRRDIAAGVLVKAKKNRKPAQAPEEKK